MSYTVEGFVVGRIGQPTHRVQDGIQLSSVPPRFDPCRRIYRKYSQYTYYVYVYGLHNPLVIYHA